MEGREEIRLEVLKGLTILAMHDEQFRREVWTDLEGTLSRYGLVLNDQEMAQVRRFHDAVVSSLEEEVYQALAVQRR